MASKKTKARTASRKPTRRKRSPKRGRLAELRELTATARSEVAELLARAQTERTIDLKADLEAVARRLVDIEIFEHDL